MNTEIYNIREDYKEYLQTNKRLLEELETLNKDKVSFEEKELFRTAIIELKTENSLIEEFLDRLESVL
jgi:uncharacterized damage-inducible protein DinB